MRLHQSQMILSPRVSQHPNQHPLPSPHLSLSPFPMEKSCKVALLLHSRPEIAKKVALNAPRSTTKTSPMSPGISVSTRQSTCTTFNVQAAKT